MITWRWGNRKRHERESTILFRVGHRGCLRVSVLHDLYRPAQSDRQTKNPDPQIRIDLSPAGYQDLSAMARRSAAANLSLNFLDNDHVLFNFNPKRMFARLPDCPPTHEDRLVHAAVYEVSTGRLVREAEWYLHDSRRYL